MVKGGFRPELAVALDLSTGQGLALHVLEELLTSVFCFLEVLRGSSVFTPALFISTQVPAVTI